LTTSLQKNKTIIIRREEEKENNYFRAESIVGESESASIPYRLLSAIFTPVCRRERYWAPLLE
jgi:hypothetical protein